MTASQAASLEEFLAAAEERNHDVRISRAQLAQARAALGRARSGVLPSVLAVGQYRRNQFDAEAAFEISPVGPVERVTIIPKDQLDGSISLNVPLFDGPALSLLGAAKYRVQSEQARDAATTNDVLLAVIEAFHETLAARRVFEAARRTLETAKATQKLIATQLSVGSTTTLQLRRAQAERARARQDLAEAKAAFAQVLRLLRRLAGLEEEPSDPSAPTDRAVSGSADHVSRAVDQNPAIRAARARLEEASAAARSEKWAYAPKLSAAATERFTNATGFSGEKAAWELSATLTWNLFDSLGRESAIRVAAERAAQAQLLVEQSEKRVRDGVIDSLSRLEAAREKLAAAQAESEAAEEADRLTREQLKAGASTSVDVAVASRDAFVAQVNLARARADLAIARARLRHATGQPLR